MGKLKEIDKENMFKFEYVRVKIVCREVAKVPAVAEGNLGDYLYDFGFKREVLQEGSTNPAGNRWIMKDGPKDQKKEALMKKQKTDDTNKKDGKSGDGYESTPPKFMAVAQKADQAPFAHKEKVNKKGKEVKIVEEDEFDSDEDDLFSEELIQPGNDMLNIDPGKKPQEERKLWKMEYRPNHAVVINEYGTNLMQSKLDL